MRPGLAQVVGCTLNEPESGPCAGWVGLNNTNRLPPAEGSYSRGP
jgi:hypothetical protein